jgi:hypothetical protein
VSLRQWTHFPFSGFLAKTMLTIEGRWVQPLPYNDICLADRRPLRNCSTAVPGRPSTGAICAAILAPLLLFSVSELALVRPSKTINAINIAMPPAKASELTARYGSVGHNRRATALEPRQWSSVPGKCYSRAQ